MPAVIYHNPRCSKSRATLAILRERGEEPTIVEYLKQPLSREELKDLISRLGIPASDLLRRSERVYKELKLDESRPEAELIEIMSQHPALMNRPIVVTSVGARLCRPPELVMEILEKTK